MDYKDLTPNLTPNELRQRLNKVSRVSLAHLPTPLELCPRLTEELGGPRILIKREDCTGLAFGGNKTRILEYVLGEAIRTGANCVIQGAAEQSNHCRQLAAAAAKLGLTAHLVLHKYDVTTEIQGNLLLDHLLGAEIHLADAPLGEKMEEAKIQLGEQLREDGETPFVITKEINESFAPLAYVDFILELSHQTDSEDIEPNHIYCSSAGATQAGMVLGTKLLGLSWQITGIAPIQWEEDHAVILTRNANSAAKKLNLTPNLETQHFTNISNYIGATYGEPSPEGLEALSLMAQTEGIVLDPLYSSKALAGLIDHIRKGRLSANDTVVFVHTGGTPALFAYNRNVLPNS
ncbi:MAG: L-cysteate sulfo-lyase [Candidatus Moanabacter tarae]|uniref:L-cysteate sulfo-lyase n=1 Tax=Candidatus Moanibacter tarae TaxID=2200854 RepID=A0A2Z4AKB6_9BACT|nr:MAG: L-cysteate sulfo-lyase [Candidatus Moanabacter tarae]|tara:strand:- start:9735 stop:10778 length:1044 start_codon:yes stop_codon:yes gene_type:complete